MDIKCDGRIDVRLGGEREHIFDDLCCENRKCQSRKRDIYTTSRMNPNLETV